MARNGQWRMSIGVARRVALGAQGFSDPRPSGRVDRRHLRRVMGRMNVLQLDSVPVVIRTQYMPFHSRLGPYSTDIVDRIAYRDDEWFEAWAHEASLLPVEREPELRWMKDRAREGHVWKILARVAEKEPGYVQSVLEEVTERGAVATSELNDPRPVDVDTNGWGTRSLGACALDWLFRVGELGVRRRGNFEKVFSPLEDIVPRSVLDAPTPTVEAAQRSLVVRSVESLGVGTAGDVADYFRLPIRDVRLRLAELVDEGAVVEARVEGWSKPAFADPTATIPRRIEGATLLSPFDPVVWNRARTERLFGFEYRIEIYVPAAKRRWGYYVLPVMVDGEIVARVDAKTDRSAGVLRVISAHAEPGHDTPATAARVATAIHDLAETVRTDSVSFDGGGELSRHFRAGGRGDRAGVGAMPSVEPSS